MCAHPSYAHSVFTKPINTLSILLALLYADDAYFASTPKSILQKSMDILTELFDRVGLRTNTEKTKVMTCVNEKVHVRRLEEVYRNTTAGFHTEKDYWRNRRVTCDHCGLEMSAKSLPGHLESQHGIYRARVIDRDLVLDDRESITYAAMQSPSNAWDCPVPDCPGSVQTPWNLWRHFRDRHPLDLVNVPGEGVLPNALGATCKLTLRTRGTMNSRRYAGRGQNGRPNMPPRLRMPVLWRWNSRHRLR